MIVTLPEVIEAAGGRRQINKMYEEFVWETWSGNEAVWFEMNDNEGVCEGAD